MQIEANLQVRSAPLPPVTVLGNTAGRDFLAALEAAGGVDTTAPEIPAASPIPETDPVELYQSITGRTIAEEPEKSAWWTDKTLADIIGGGRTNINTTKTINWSSQGDRKLTAEQITDLKGKYNVSNLSSQEYYDLLSDLTHLGALSGEDCIGAHLNTFQGPQVVFTPHDEKILIRRLRPFQTGDMLSIFSCDLDILMNHLAWSGTEQCRQMNSSATPEEWAQYRAGIQKDIQCRQKVLDLLNQLR